MRESDFKISYEAIAWTRKLLWATISQQFRNPSWVVPHSVFQLPAPVVSRIPEPIMFNLLITLFELFQTVFAQVVIDFPAIQIRVGAAVFNVVGIARLFRGRSATWV